MLTDDAVGSPLLLRAPLGRRARPTSPTRTPPSARPWCSSTRPRRCPRRWSPASARPGRTRTSPTDSNAGPAVRALGSTPRLVWYQPGTGDALAPGLGGSEHRRRPLGLAAVDRPGHRAAAGHRRAPRVRPGPPARSPGARAAARRGARHRDHREPRPPLPPGRRPGPRRRRAALGHPRTPHPPAGRRARRRARAPWCTPPRWPPGARPARWLTSCSGRHRPTTPP